MKEFLHKEVRVLLEDGRWMEGRLVGCDERFNVVLMSSKGEFVIRGDQMVLVGEVTSL